MLYFLDTEYQRRETSLPELISVGIISEDGRREFYAELPQPQDLSPWVKKNVVDVLTGPILTLTQVQNELMAWLSTGPRQIKLASDDDLDFVLIRHLLAGFPANVLPERMDLRPLVDTSIFHHAVCRYQEIHGCWHHALHDAKAHRAGWLAWMNEQAKKLKQKR